MKLNHHQSNNIHCFIIFIMVFIGIRSIDVSSALELIKKCALHSSLIRKT